MTSALLTYLRQQSYHTKQRFRYDIGVATIKNITWNHLEQKLMIKDAIPPATGNQPAFIDRAGMDQRLKSTRAKNVNGTFGVLPGRRNAKGKRIGAEERGRCDSCFIRAAQTGDQKVPGSEELPHIECERSGVTKTCTNCERMGMSCSWTETAVLCAPNSPVGIAIRHALSCPPAVSPTTFRISDPGLKVYDASAL